MLMRREELIGEIEEHIRRSGGARREWFMGTAKDARSPFFHQHLEADLGDGLIYREAFTTDAARAIQHHFVYDCGLQPDLNTTPKTRQDRLRLPQDRLCPPRNAQRSSEVPQARGMKSGGQPRVSVLRELMGSFQYLRLITL
jgi:hypothetical protein